MFSKLTDLQMFIEIIEKEYGNQDAYRYLVDDLIVNCSVIPDPIHIASIG